MNNEIKEILELYREKDIEYYNAYSRLTVEDILDYITNLQTIEQQYSAILSENAELENKITNLKEENKYLADELNKEIIRGDELFDRIDKAIKHIQKDRKRVEKMAKKYNIFVKDDPILNILQGSDDNE